MHAIYPFLLISFFAIWPGHVSAQYHPGGPGTFQVGTTQIQVTDTSLSTPTYTADIFYPASNSGSSVPVAQGKFPIIAFGHGFNIGHLNYTQINEHHASHGYIVIVPDVQNGFSVDHLEMSREMAAGLTFMMNLDQDTSSLFYSHVDTMTAVIGHSMGGGASAMVHTVFPQIDVIAGLSAAETNPSAISALTSWSGPFLAISGTDDNVTPEAQHQIPMYNSATGNKLHISLQGGSHCKYTDGSTVCDFVSNPGSMARQEQIDHSKTFTTAWFDYHMKGDTNALPWICGDSIQTFVNANTLTFSGNTNNCSAVSVEHLSPDSKIKVYPNPFQEKIQVNISGNWQLFDRGGNELKAGRILKPSDRISLGEIPEGLYLFRITNAEGVFSTLVNKKGL